MNDILRNRRKDDSTRERILASITGKAKAQAQFTENPQYEKLLADPELAAAVMTRGLRKDLDRYQAAKAQQEAK